MTYNECIKMLNPASVMHDHKCPDVLSQVQEIRKIKNVK